MWSRRLGSTGGLTTRLARGRGRRRWILGPSGEAEEEIVRIEPTGLGSRRLRRGGLYSAWSGRGLWRRNRSLRRRRSLRSRLSSRGEEQA